MAPQNNCEPPKGPPHGPPGGRGHGGFFHQMCVGKSLNVSDEQKESMKLCGSKVFGLPTESASTTAKSQRKFPSMQVRACGMVCVAQTINMVN